MEEDVGVYKGMWRYTRRCWGYSTWRGGICGDAGHMRGCGGIRGDVGMHKDMRGCVDIYRDVGVNEGMRG